MCQEGDGMEVVLLRGDRWHRGSTRVNLLCVDLDGAAAAGAVDFD